MDQAFFNQIKRMVISNNVQKGIQLCAGTQAHLEATSFKKWFKRANQSREIKYKVL